MEKTKKGSKKGARIFFTIASIILLITNTITGIMWFKSVQANKPVTKS